MAKRGRKGDLTEKEKRFAEAYVRNGGSATDAMREAYGMNLAKNTVAVRGCEVKKRPDVAAYIEELKEIAATAAKQKYGVTVERVLQELSRVAFSDLRPVFNENGSMKATKDWPDELAAMISSIEVTERSGGVSVTKVRLWSKTEALASLAKYLKLWNDAPQIPPAPPNDADLTEAARRIAFALSLAKETIDRAKEPDHAG